MNLALTVILTVAVIIGIATLIVMRGRKEYNPSATRAISGVVMMAVSLILIILLNSAYTAYSIQQSQQKWCDTLNLLTSHQVPKPSNPTANPSREQAYILYSDFVSLRERFGCGG